MVKIIRYEVYSDRGDGWKLEDQFSNDDRQNAAMLAKEIESTGMPVKMIREIYETDDGSFQETVEYISNLNKRVKPKVVSVEDAIFDNLTGEYNVEATPLKMLAQNEVSKAFVKLFLIIVFSLVLSNILIELSVPIIEFMVPDEQRKSVLFFGFFAIFIAIAGPLLFYKVPWNVFYSLHKDDKEVINEKTFFRRAANLMKNYNLNDNGREVITPTFPEAPLEYKQYVIDYLTQILNNLGSEIKLQDSFNRLGVELVVYGGCLELARYGRLVWAEANSLLYETFKVLEGDKADLQAFYDAKQSYKDNKVAVFLTGVGAYLMSQITNDIPMDANVLTIAIDKWVKSKDVQETQNAEEKEVVDPGFQEQDELDTVFRCMANLRINMHIFDDEKDVSEEEQNSIKGELRDLISMLVTKYHGNDVIEENDITSVHFNKLGRAAQFVTTFFNKLEEFKEQKSEYNLIVDAKAAVLDVPSDQDVNLAPYVSDILEYAYNQEIIVNDAVKDELLESSYSFEFLGDKELHKSGQKTALYKMSF